MKSFLKAGFGLLALFALAAVANAQPVVLPQVTSINQNDLFLDIPNGAPTANSVYANGALLGNFGATQNGNNQENTLIGGDFSTNLFSYGTTVSSITTTPTFVANRWIVWSGTSTTIAGTQQTGAADIPQNYGASLRLTRSGTGVIQVCAMQVVETVNAIRYQGQVAEFNFHALAGAGFSAASSNLAAYILTGTGTDEGALKAAFSINAGGGLAVGWTGATRLGGATGFLVPINAAWNRYLVAAPIPVTATEIAVAICWTPVGTTTTNDYFEFTGVQLAPNSSLATAAGAAGAYIGVNDARTKSFVRRSQQIETALQQRYFWVNNETGTQAFANGMAASTTTAFYVIPNPVTMRTIPTPKATVGSMRTISSTGTAINLTALAATASGSGPTNIQLTGTVALGLTIAPPQATVLTGNSGVGQVGADAEIY